MTIQTLTSPKNPLLKSVRRAVARGECTEDGYCVAEGVHLLEEAVRSGAEIGPVFVAERSADRMERWTGLQVVAVPESILREIATTETSQGVVSLVRARPVSLERIQPGLVVALDAIQEPGNAGAIIRVAEAFGATGVVALKGTVNPYNPKALRASAGSIFRVPCAHGVTSAELIERSWRLLATVPDRAVAVHEADLASDCAIVVGSEGHGVSSELLARCTPISIPTRGVESLNAAVAAGIVLYEAQRQRGGV